MLEHELEEFVAWVGARDVAPPFLPAYRAHAQRIAEGVEGPVYPRHVDAALLRAEREEMPPRELANLQRVGDALVRYFASRQEASVPPSASDAASASAARAASIRPIIARGPAGGPLLTLIWLGGLLVVLGGGFFAYKRLYLGAGNATLEAFDAGRFILVLHARPSGCRDPRDLRVEITSSVLQEPLSFDWPTLARRSVGQVLDAEADPPIDRPIKIHYDLPFKERIVDPDMEDFLLRAKVYWCGKQQDHGRSNARGMYTQVHDGR